MSGIPTLQDLVFEVADIQFTDNNEREAVRARDEARELVRKAHAAGAAAERARVVAVLETQMEETRERLRKLSEANSDEYVNVLYELDGLRRFSGKVAQ